MPAPGASDKTTLELGRGVPLAEARIGEELMAAEYETGTASRAWQAEPTWTGTVVSLCWWRHQHRYDLQEGRQSRARARARARTGTGRKDGDGRPRGPADFGRREGSF